MNSGNPSHVMIVSDWLMNEISLNCQFGVK